MEKRTHLGWTRTCSQVESVREGEGADGLVERRPRRAGEVQQGDEERKKQQDTPLN